MELERLTRPFKEALNLGFCFYELGVLAAREFVRQVDDAISDCWPADDPIDAAIPSSIRNDKDSAA